MDARLRAEAEKKQKSVDLVKAQADSMRHLANFAKLGHIEPASSKWDRAALKVLKATKWSEVLPLEVISDEGRFERAVRAMNAQARGELSLMSIEDGNLRGALERRNLWVPEGFGLVGVRLWTKPGQNVFD